MTPFDYFILFGSVMLGGIAGLRFPQLRSRYLHLVLSFSGAYLLSITATHVLPEAFAGNSQQVGLAILAGFFLQVLFEQLSSGVEHGHVHVHEGQRVAIPVLIGLSLHALLEGSPLTFVEDQAHIGHDHNHLVTGLALHKLPAGFALSVLLLSAGYSKKKVVFMLALFAIMSPLGAFLAAGLLPTSLVPLMLGLVAGSLLHVGTTILFELDGPHQHRLSWKKVATIGAGIGVALATSYI